MGWAMLASVLAPYIIQAFQGGNGPYPNAGQQSLDSQAQADTNQMRTELLRQIQNQNHRFDSRNHLDAQVVSLMQSLMPTEASGLISPGADQNQIGGTNPSTPYHPPPDASTGRVYKSEPTGPSVSSTNGDGSSMATRSRTYPSVTTPAESLPGGSSPATENAQNLPEYMFKGWLDSLPNFQQALAKRRMN